MSIEKDQHAKDESATAMGRRYFIKASALVGAGMATGIHESAIAKSPSAVHSSAYERIARKLGELEVSPLGLGCMSMSSGSYNPPRSVAEMEPVIRGAFDEGVTFFDTAEVYGPFTNETLVGEALKPIRNNVILASKFGFDFSNSQRSGRDARPASIRKAVEGMLSRLQTDRIDLLYLHRADPNVPIEDVAGTVGELVKEGKARHFGLSEVSPDTIRKAHKEFPVSAVQSEYSIIERAMENQVLDTCKELGIGFVPWGAVCRGYLADKFNEYSRFSDESRLSSVPYFTPEALANNRKILDLVRSWGAERNLTPAQFSLAWVLSQGDFIVPIPGSTKLHHIRENQGALNVRFSQQELAEFRTQLDAIALVGVRNPDSVLENK